MPAVTRFPARAEGLADRMAGFVAHLRMNGAKLGPAEAADGLAALACVDALDPARARLALKALYAPDAEGWDAFDDLFDAYWFNAGKQRAGSASTHVKVQSAKPMLWKGHLGEEEGAEEAQSEATPEAGGDGEEEAEGSDGRLIATRSQNLRKRDLRELMDEASLREAEAVAARLAHVIRDRRSRRRKQALRGRELDLRRIQRASLARGGEPLDLFHRTRPERPMRLVVLADVSGSMTVYSRVFLAFSKGLMSADTSAEAFLFHTRLMRVTPALRDHDSLRAAGRLSLMAEGFGGGTDIGGALTTFADQYGQILNRRTLVVVLSDGYCTGAAENVGLGLARIRRRAGRIVWLNPLKGWANYAPVAAAIKAAAPHLDAHLPANTLSALAALEGEFAKL
ncbi:VWA domain containing CoxE-like protein [Pseudoruegeria aquimaris]|uniref:VWA domain containing CoxE-like protein n=1 Tax=Pseudoruegeria aquimaris TaxID=393663 RepID=A0A1Y5RP62_9RHOB|nr:VWA domain-containing protein [Pseudoruegeria aquimaris]SLN22126.1 VWA domain containing CoxE-like protein [Pseudoruegeria aquimaris]